MIVFDKLWKTMHDKGITQYDLYTYHGINRSLLDRLRHNKNVETNTIDRLCEILDCNVYEIMEYKADKVDWLLNIKESSVGLATSWNSLFLSL